MPDFEDSGDFDPPPQPAGLSPSDRYAGKMMEWFAGSVIAETKRASRRATEERKAAEQAAERRTALIVGELRDVKAAVSGVKATVDKEHAGPIARFGAWIDSMPIVKSSIGMSVAVFIGGGLLALGGYLGFGAFAVPSTPTPVPVSVGSR